MAIRLDPIRSKRKMGVRNITGFFQSFLVLAFIRNRQLLSLCIIEEY